MHEIDETIAKMQEFLDAGVVGYHGLYSKNQQDYRNMWWELSIFVNELRNEHFDDFFLTSIKNKMNTLASEAPQAPEPFAVNTTRYGRENEQGN